MRSPLQNSGAFPDITEVQVASTHGLAQADKELIPDSDLDLWGMRNLFTQSQRNMYANRPYYRLDGTSDYIEYADDPDLDVGICDFALTIVFKPDSVATANQFLMNKEDSGIGYGLEMRLDDLWIRFDDDTEDATAIIGTGVFEAGVIADVIVSFERADLATAKVNGVIVGTVDISGTPLTLSNGGVLRIGTETGGTTKEFKGEIYDWGVWNTVISESKALELQAGGALNYLDVGASNFNMFNEPAFGSDAKWDKTGEADDTGGDAEWTFNAGSLEGTITQTAANRAGVGAGSKQYRFIRTTTVTTAPDGDTVFSITTGFALAAVVLTMTAGTAEHVEFTSKEAAAAGDFVFDITEATATQGQFAIDDLVLNQIGNVLSVGGDSFQSGFAYDRSGNGLKGTVNGATLHNIEVSGEVVGVTFIVGGSHDTTVNVAMQFTDAAGNDISHSVAGLFYLADDTSGLIFTSSGPDGANAINGDGAAIEIIADKLWVFNTESDGDITFDVIHSGGAVNWYMVVILPDGRLAVSGKIEVT